MGVLKETNYGKKPLPVDHGSRTMRVWECGAGDPTPHRKLSLVPYWPQDCMVVTRIPMGQRPHTTVTKARMPPNCCYLVQDDIPGSRWKLSQNVGQARAGWVRWIQVKMKMRYEKKPKNKTHLK